jgi:preprotein translocase subunit SecG
VFNRLKKNSRLDERSSVLNDRRGRTVPVAVLLIFVVLLSMGSGIYASASYFAPQASNVTVTTTIYTTTTSWTTSTIWSTVTSTVLGVLTTVQYTTSTSTVTVTGSTSTPSIVTIGGTSVATDFAKAVAASPITLSAGTVQTIGINWANTQPGDVIVALYSDAGTKPGSLLTQSASTPMSGSAGWQDITVTPYTVSAGRYWVAFSVDSARYIYFGSGARSYYAKSFGPMDATWRASSSQDNIYMANLRVTTE